MSDLQWGWRIPCANPHCHASIQDWGDSSGPPPLNPWKHRRLHGWIVIQIGRRNTGYCNLGRRNVYRAWCPEHQTESQAYRMIAWRAAKADYQADRLESLKARYADRPKAIEHIMADLMRQWYVRNPPPDKE